MSNIVTDIKALQEETLINLQNSKAKNTVEHTNQILKILVYFVFKMALKIYLPILK